MYSFVSCYSTCAELGYPLVMEFKVIDFTEAQDA